MTNTSVLIIAEIGQAHDGSLGILHSYIDAVASTGVDAIKFQTHIAEAESSKFEPFRVPFSYEDKTRFDYWERMSFTLEQWKGVKAHCDDVGLEFMSSPFSNAAVDLLEEVGVKRYKIGSGEVSNFLMLEKIATTGKEILLSSGMSSYSELQNTIAFLEKRGAHYSLFQCTTSYPTSFDKVGLNVIPEMIERFGVKVGLSDHSGSIFPSLAAVAMGASMIEVHAVFDKRMFGPDSTSSLQIDQLKVLVDGVRAIETMLDAPINKEDNSSFDELKVAFGKSLAVNRSMKRGQVIDFSTLEAKKPFGKGVPANEFEAVLGRRLLRDLDCWDFLRWSDLGDR